MDLKQLASDLWTDARLFASASEDRLNSDQNIARLQRKLRLAVDGIVNDAVSDQRQAIINAAEKFLYRKRKLLVQAIDERTEELGDIERKLKAVKRTLADKSEVLRKREKRAAELEGLAAAPPKITTRRTEPIVHKRTSQSLARELDELEAKQ